VTNFATLRDAQVSLNKLLVLMGPNNSGKSTAAVLLYAACRSGPWGRTVVTRANRRVQTRGWTASPPEFDQRYIPRAVRELRRQARDSRSITDLFDNLPQSTRALMVRPMKQMLNTYAKAYAKEIERCFGGTLRELARKPSDGRPTKIELTHGSEWRVTITLTKGRASFDSDLVELDDDAWRSIVAGVHQDAIAHLRRALRRSDPDEGEFALHLLFDFVMVYLFRHFPRAAYYLPASRSGALQSHRVLAAAMIRQSSYVGIEDVAIPKLPGVVADFIGQLLVLNPNRQGQYAEIANKLQSEVLHGEIELSANAPTAPEISFSTGEAKHALHRTSSMVSELAPVVLFLRHVVGPRDLLIIEEPESHLHPASQISFVLTLARLVTSGVFVAVTTHSDYFINQVNNMIMAAAITLASGDDGAAVRASADPEAVIPPECANAYLFKPDGALTAGSIVRSLPVGPEGISDADFADVAEWLYNMSAALAQEVNSNGA
jgi:ABC-type cobalamin/Fe3+-siderophores transport system ATPase subunit